MTEVTSLKEAFEIAEEYLLKGLTVEIIPTISGVYKLVIK